MGTRVILVYLQHLDWRAFDGSLLIQKCTLEDNKVNKTEHSDLEMLDIRVAMSVLQCITVVRQPFDYCIDDFQHNIFDSRK